MGSALLEHMRGLATDYLQAMLCDVTDGKIDAPTNLPVSAMSLQASLPGLPFMILLPWILSIELPTGRNISVEIFVLCVQELLNDEAQASQWLNLNGPENPISLPVLQLLLANKDSTRCARKALICIACCAYNVLVCMHRKEDAGIICPGAGTWWSMHLLCWALLKGWSSVSTRTWMA